MSGEVIILLIVIVVIVAAFIRFRPSGQNSETGWRQGSIGDISARIGYDVRDLYTAGYTQQEIDGILKGEYTLNELLQRGPKNPK